MGEFRQLVQIILHQRRVGGLDGRARASRLIAELILDLASAVAH